MKKTLFFILLAVPGVVLYLGGLGWLLLGFRERIPALALLGGLGVVCGPLAMIYGTGHRGRWLHAVPLLATPFVFVGVLVLCSQLTASFINPLLPAGVLSMFALAWMARVVGRHYARRG